MKLYELTEQYNALLALFNSEVIDEQTFTDTLNALQGDIENKADNIAKLIKSIEHQEDALRQEEVRMASRRKAYENHRQGLKGYLEAQMLNMGKEKIKISLFNFYISNNTPALKLSKETEDYPEKYKRIEVSLDKRMMMDDIKAGIIIEGEEISQSKSLKIK